MTDISAPLYQLRYSLTREDVAAFEFLPRELQGLEKLWLFGPVLACGALVGLFEDQLRPYLPWDPSTQGGQIAIVACAILVGYGLSLLLLTARTRHRVRKAHVPSPSTVVDAFADHVRVEEDGVARTLAWRDVTVTATDQHVFLQSAPGQVVIIPLRAFDGISDLRAFASFAEAAGRDPEDREQGVVDNNKETEA